MEENLRPFKPKKWKYSLILLVPAGIALFVWIVMLLWNGVLVNAVSGIHNISFWQAAGILALAKILFGGHFSKRRRPHHPGSIRANWSRMSEEEKQKFREQWNQRCNPRC